MKKYCLLFFLFISAFQLLAQSIQSPSGFLNYKLGEKFSQHHRVIEYFKYLADASKCLKLQQYGKTYEGRPLLLAFISSQKNIDKLEKIRNSNLQLGGFEGGQANPDQPAIVWLSYNVHGNEAVSTEAAMQTVFELLDPQNTDTKKWLENTVVIVDPCMNPDGRERYVNFYSSVANIIPDGNPYTREHLEPWPGGRTNHYYFDLNRDWAWQTQIETQQRMAVYNRWLPQVHVDFHEQGYNNPYYFAPAAEPFHEDVTSWQREFQTLIGKSNARYFDEKGWLYFTKERFDLLYPSYGDTYPTYNGAIGMTYEQGGSGRAGLAVVTEVGDTLTLKDRILHHVTTGLSTVEVTSSNFKKVLNEFKLYFEKAKTNPSGIYRTYVVKSDNTDRLSHLATLLKKNGIKFGFGANKPSSGYNYFTGKTENFTINASDMVITAYQPKSVLAKVLFEPKTFVSDSVTYDITAWSLPYAYGLKAYASKERIEAQFDTPVAKKSAAEAIKPTLAFVANWGSVNDVKFLAKLLSNDIKVRCSEVPFEISGKKFNIGSLIITRTGNERIGKNFESAIRSIALETETQLFLVQSGIMDKGADLGSDKVRYIRKPRIALVGGEESSSQAFGEIWHFFEQQIKFPLSVLRAKDLKFVNLTDFNVLIFPDGEYEDIASEKIQNWVDSGGKLIAMENAVAQLAGKKGFILTNKEEAKDDKIKNPYKDIKKYQDRERESVQTGIPGAIYRVDLDNTHPLGYGFPDFYHTLKLDDKMYNFLEGGWNVGVLKKNNYVTGFVGNHAKRALVDGLLFGVQELGSGSVVYLTEDPLFRGFWENGKLLFSNAVFMVGL